MKNFGELKIGDKIYLNDNFDIKEITIIGIEDVRFEHQYVILKLKNSHSCKLQYNASEGTIGIYNKNYKIYTSLQACQVANKITKKDFIDEQFRIAMSAFRKIKKVSYNFKDQQKRVLEFFQLLEKEEE